MDFQPKSFHMFTNYTGSLQININMNIHINVNIKIQRSWPMWWGPWDRIPPKQSSKTQLTRHLQTITIKIRTDKQYHQQLVYWEILKKHSSRAIIYRPPYRILRSGLRAASSTSYLDQVDVDGSGAVEWEEFCVLMYRKVLQTCAVYSDIASLASTSPSYTWIQLQAPTPFQEFVMTLNWIFSIRCWPFQSCETYKWRGCSESQLVQISKQCSDAREKSRGGVEGSLQSLWCWRDRSDWWTEKQRKIMLMMNMVVVKMMEVVKMVIVKIVVVKMVVVKMTVKDW